MTGVTAPEAAFTNRSFDGAQGMYKHASAATDTVIDLSVFVPLHAERAKLSFAWYHSGFAGTHANLTEGGEYRHLCAALGLIFVAPDTSPPVGNVADDAAYNFGMVAGSYVEAAQAPFDRRFKMWSHVTREPPPQVVEHFPVDMDRQSIMGHNMGGQGALTIGLTYIPIATRRFPHSLPSSRHRWRPGARWRCADVLIPRFRGLRIDHRFFDLRKTAARAAGTGHAKRCTTPCETMGRRKSDNLARAILQCASGSGAVRPHG